MKRIEVYQALWGMIDLPSREAPYTIEESLSNIEAAGFVGALNYIDTLSEATLLESYRISQLINAGNLKLGLSCHGESLQDMKDKIDYAASVKGEFLNIMVRSYYIYGDEAVELLKAVIDYGKNAGVKVFIESHRGTLTQDLIRSAEYVDAIDEMMMTIDLSHYVVAGEIEIPDAPLEAHFDKLLQRTGSVHMRLSNGEQVQVSLDRISDQQLSHFKRWWSKGLDYGIARLKPEECLPVVVELGPENYHQKLHTGDGWLYDGDRWEETLRLKELIESL